jgi:Sec-independent protein translocase protein TatA
LGKALGQTLRGFKEEMGKTTSEEDSEIKEWDSESVIRYWLFVIG